MFIEDNEALNRNQLEKLYQKLNKEEINFYLSFRAVELGDKGFHFCCESLNRKGKKNKHYSYFKSLLISILKKHNLKLKKIHRMAVNVTFNNGYVKEVPLHKDHDFPHKQLLLYLNDSTGDTIIPYYNKTITPKENKAIIFDGIEHKHIFPETGIRIVCVFTFSISNNINCV